MFHTYEREWNRMIYCLKQQVYIYVRTRKGEELRGRRRGHQKKEADEHTHTYMYRTKEDIDEIHMTS